MFKNIRNYLCSDFITEILTWTVFAQNNDENPTYLKSVINTPNAVEIKKSTIFDASQSFVPENNKNAHYEMGFWRRQSQEESKCCTHTKTRDITL